MKSKTTELTVCCLRLYGASQPAWLLFARASILLAITFSFASGVVAWSQGPATKKASAQSGNAAADEVAPPQQPAAPPNGLEFLKAYPALYGLSLDMTEKQFLKIVKQQKLTTTKTGKGDQRQHQLNLGDGHTLIVMFDKAKKCKGIQRVRGAEDASVALADVPNKSDPSQSVLTTIDNAPANQARAVIKQLDDAGERKLASLARERLAKRWKRISEQNVLSFMRPVPPKDPATEPIDRGPLVDVQTELDGVWSNAKGTIDSWKDWVARKQDDYRVERLRLLFEAAEGFRKVADPASAERVLMAGLSGYEIYDADLEVLLQKYWPLKDDKPEKSLGTGPHAWTLVNFLTELSSAQQELDETEEAIETHSRLTLAHFMLSWQHPSAGPTKQARELWSLIRQQPESSPPLFWFNVVNEQSPQQKFDLSKAGKKGEPLTYHHQNLAAAAPLEFKELTITARTTGAKGFLSCYRINAAGKHETIGLIQATTSGESETLTKKLPIPPGTSLVQFMVAGDDFQVGEVTIEATFVTPAGDRVDKAADAELRLTGGEVTAEAIAKMAGRHWGTVTLAEARFTGEIVERLRHASSIRELRLFGTGLSGQIPRLEHVTGLVSLELGTPLTGHDLEAIGELTQLERLSLPQELTINVSGAQELARLVRLKALKLYNVNIDDAAFSELRTLIALEELDLTHTRITDEGLKTIEKMPGLRILELHRHPDWYLKQQLTDACLASIAKLPELERLSLSGKISNAGLKLVGRWPKLKSLSILSTEITGEGFAALAESNIEQLTVATHQLGDEPAVAEELKKLRHLKRIHVIGKGMDLDSKWPDRLPKVSWSFSS